MKPRGYFATFIQLASITALTSAVVWSWLFASIMRRSFGEVLLPEGLTFGVAVGVLGGAIGAFNIRAITMTVPIGPDRDEFLSGLTLRLAEIGYHPEQPIGNAYTFRPSFYVGRAAGRITVVVERLCSDATVLGPVIHLRKLRKLLTKNESAARASLATDDR